MSVIIISIIVSIAATVGLLSYYVSGPDNKVEEVCEDVIEQATGVDIDLSPDSPEVKLQQAPVESPLAGVNGSDGS